MSPARIVIRCPRAVTIKARAHEVRQAETHRRLAGEQGRPVIYRVPAKTVRGR
jgi:hypothetical protein